MLTNLGCNFHEVLEFIVATLDKWYLELYAILIDIRRTDVWPLLDLGWPVTDLI